MLFDQNLPVLQRHLAMATGKGWNVGQKRGDGTYCGWRSISLN